MTSRAPPPQQSQPITSQQHMMGVPKTSVNQPAPTDTDPASVLFDQFCVANTFQGIMTLFQALCDQLGLKRSTGGLKFYEELKKSLRSWRAQSVWLKLDKRAEHWEYGSGSACNNTRVLVIGGGPCGLRCAIELALLGARVVLVEKRDKFSRNNVLHLWPFLIHDLKSLAAKKFFGKFCAGSIDHVSIRTLQCMLLKMALLLGVEVHSGVTFEDLVEPTQSNPGWKARVSPEQHPVSEYSFDVCVGADGKRNTIKGFKRKEFRGKLAIAITANFINHHTQAESCVEEISGVAYIFNQKFFNDLNDLAGIDLENIVYYKDETHYFVMTAKKQSLLNKGVLKQDSDDAERLLSQDNVDQDALLSYARQAATLSTQNRLPDLKYAHNHYGKPDVAMFDFTSMFAAEHASRVVEKEGQRLLMCLVGDSLTEPFWPTGSGCARGFLSALDAAWMVRRWSSNQMTPLEVMAERESIYQLLSQTTPDNLSRNIQLYTVDPNTRYRNLDTTFFKVHQVRGQYEGADEKTLDEIIRLSEINSNNRYDEMRDNQSLLRWYQRQLQDYEDLVRVDNLTSSWADGMALACLLQKFRPNLINVYTLDQTSCEKNIRHIFELVEQELGLRSLSSYTAGGDVFGSDGRLNSRVLTLGIMRPYLYQFYEYFRKESSQPPPQELSSDIKRLDREETTKRIAALRKQPSTESSSEPNSGVNKKKRRSQELKGGEEEGLGAGAMVGGGAFDVPSKYRIRDIDDSEMDEDIAGMPRFEDIARELRQMKETGEWDENVASSRVTSLARGLESKLEPRSQPPPVQSTRSQPVIVSQGKLHESDVCYFCKERVYVVERYTAEGLYFHRQCLRCDYCGCTLRLSSYAFSRDSSGKGTFFCQQHYGMKKQAQKPPTGHSGVALSSNAPLRRSGRHQRGASRKAEPAGRGAVGKGAGRGAGPGGGPRERAEYMTESEIEEDESVQARHNNITLLRATAFSDSSSSSSELELQFSDDDATEEEPDRMWAELAKRSLHLKQLLTNKNSDSSSNHVNDSNTRSKKGASSESKKRLSGASSGSETMGASDADYETDDNSSDSAPSGAEKNKARDCTRLVLAGRGVVKHPQAVTEREVLDMEERRRKASEDSLVSTLLASLTTPPRRSEATSTAKPIVKSAEVLRNRMAFFSAVTQPVRINAKEFLGLDPKPDLSKASPEEEGSGDTGTVVPSEVAGTEETGAAGVDGSGETGMKEQEKKEESLEKKSPDDDDEVVDGSAKPELGVTQGSEAEPVLSPDDQLVPVISGDVEKMSEVFEGVDSSNTVIQTSVSSDKDGAKGSRSGQRTRSGQGSRSQASSRSGQGSQSGQSSSQGSKRSKRKKQDGKKNEMTEGLIATSSVAGGAQLQTVPVVSVDDSSSEGEESSGSTNEDRGEYADSSHQVDTVDVEMRHVGEKSEDSESCSEELMKVVDEGEGGEGGEEGMDIDRGDSDKRHCEHIFDSKISDDDDDAKRDGDDLSLRQHDDEDDDTVSYVTAATAVSCVDSGVTAAEYCEPIEGQDGVAANLCEPIIEQSEAVVEHSESIRELGDKPTVEPLEADEHKSSLAIPTSPDVTSTEIGDSVDAQSPSTEVCLDENMKTVESIPNMTETLKSGENDQNLVEGTKNVECLMSSGVDEVQQHEINQTIDQSSNQLIDKSSAATDEPLKKEAPRDASSRDVLYRKPGGRERSQRSDIDARQAVSGAAPKALIDSFSSDDDVYEPATTGYTSELKDVSQEAQLVGLRTETSEVVEESHTASEQAFSSPVAGASNSVEEVIITETSSKLQTSTEDVKSSQRSSNTEEIQSAELISPTVQQLEQAIESISQAVQHLDPAAQPCSPAVQQLAKEPPISPTMQQLSNAESNNVIVKSSCEPDSYDIDQTQAVEKDLEIVHDDVAGVVDEKEVVSSPVNSRVDEQSSAERISHLLSQSDTTADKSQSRLLNEEGGDSEPPLSSSSVPLKSQERKRSRGDGIPAHLDPLARIDLLLESLSSLKTSPSQTPASGSAAGSGRRAERLSSKTSDGAAERPSSLILVDEIKSSSDSCPVSTTSGSLDLPVMKEESHCVGLSTADDLSSEDLLSEDVPDISLDVVAQPVIQCNGEASKNDVSCDNVPKKEEVSLRASASEERIMNNNTINELHGSQEGSSDVKVKDTSDVKVKGSIEVKESADTKIKGTTDLKDTMNGNIEEGLSNLKVAEQILSSSQTKISDKQPVVEEVKSAQPVTSRALNVVSPNRLLDAKRKFFNEAPQPVRIDPRTVFREMEKPTSSSLGEGAPRTPDPSQTAEAIAAHDDKTSKPGDEGLEPRKTQPEGSPAVARVSRVDNNNSPVHRLLPSTPLSIDSANLLSESSLGALSAVSDDSHGVQSVFSEAPQASEAQHVGSDNTSVATSLDLLAEPHDEGSVGPSPSPMREAKKGAGLSKSGSDRSSASSGRSGSERNVSSKTSGSSGSRGLLSKIRPQTSVEPRVGPVEIGRAELGPGIIPGGGAKRVEDKTRPSSVYVVMSKGWAGQKSGKASGAGAMGVARDTAEAGGSGFMSDGGKDKTKAGPSRHNIFQKSSSTSGAGPESRGAGAESKGEGAVWRSVDSGGGDKKEKRKSLLAMFKPSVRGTGLGSGGRGVKSPVPPHITESETNSAPESTASPSPSSSLAYVKHSNSQQQLKQPATSIQQLPSSSDKQLSTSKQSGKQPSSSSKELTTSSKQQSSSSKQQPSSSKQQAISSTKQKSAELSAAEKTKSAGAEKKKTSSTSDSSSKKTSKSRTSSSSSSGGGGKSRRQADTLTSAGTSSVYETMAPIMEGIKRVEKRNRDKNNIRERMQAVAPPPAKAPYTVLLPPKADAEEVEETESEMGDDRISVTSLPVASEGGTEGRQERRAQRQAARRAKEKQMKRLRIAQEIQRQLEEVELKQQDVELRGVAIEKALQGELLSPELSSVLQSSSKVTVSPAAVSSGELSSEQNLMQEWFNIVHERNALMRYESELMVHARELELEDRQCRLEAQLRERIPITDSGDGRSEGLVEEEKRILQELMEVVEQRDALVALLEEERVRQQQYDRNLEKIITDKGFMTASPQYTQQLRQPLEQLRAGERYRLMFKPMTDEDGDRPDS